MKCEQNKNDYMSLIYGPNWRSLIKEPNQMDEIEEWNRIFDKLDSEFCENPDWAEAVAAELFWVGTVKLGEKEYFIGGEDQMCDVFMIEKGA